MPATCGAGLIKRPATARTPICAASPCAWRLMSPNPATARGGFWSGRRPCTAPEPRKGTATMNPQVTGTGIFWAMAAVIVLLLIVVAKAVSVANHHAGAARAAATQAASLVTQTQQQPARRGRGGMRLLMAVGAAGALLWLASSMIHPGTAQLPPQAHPTVTSPSPQPAPGPSRPAPVPAAPGSRSPLTGAAHVTLVAILSVATIPIAIARRGRG